MSSPPPPTLLELPLSRKRPGTNDNEAEDTSPPSKRQELQAERSHDELCSRCSTIDWAQLLDEVPTSQYGQLITTVSTPQARLCSAEYPMCRLLAQIKPASLDGEDCQLKAFSSRLSFAYDTKLRRKGAPLPPQGNTPECTVLYFVPKSTGQRLNQVARRGWYQSGALGILPVLRGRPRCGSREVWFRSIDYGVVKQWMSVCANKHRKSCVSLSANSLPWLRVVDCKTRAVTSAPTSCRYVALSYIWGPPAETPLVEGQFSSVVEDTILVALALGFRFLWVDKYVSALQLHELTARSQCHAQLLTGCYGRELP